MRIQGLGAIAAACVMTLTACGGGSGGPETGTEMTLQQKWQLYADGDSASEMSESEIIDLVNSVERLRTHSTYGHDYNFNPGTGTWSGWAGPFGTYTDSFEPDQVLDSIPDGFTVSSILEHRGVRLVNVEGDQTFTPEDLSYEPYRTIGEQYFGFLTFGMFWTSKFHECWGASVSSCDETSLGESSSLDVQSGSSGRFAGENPTGLGSATWTGVMTGVDVKRSKPGTTHWVLGDAKIDIDDLSDPDVDVAFTGIRDLASGAAGSDMTWSNLTLTTGGFSDGEFSIHDYNGGVVVEPTLDGSPSEPSQTETQEETIRGMFYGPSHQEVGGVFDRDGLTGAFGAKRQ